MPDRLTWSGVLAIEGEPTGDGRIIAPGALSWRDLPLTLTYQAEQPPMGIGNMNPHAGARIVGSLEQIWRDPDDEHRILGAGTIGTTEDGKNFAQALQDGSVKGVSVDLDDVTAEWLGDEDAAPEDDVYEIQQGRIMGATACAFPAIMGAEIALDDGEALAVGDGEEVDPEAPHAFKDSGDGTCAVCGKPEADHGEDGMPRPSVEASVSRSEALVAAAMAYPPESWFSDPHLSGLTALRITEDGEIIGHACSWTQPHTALAGRTAPRSASGYAYFRTGARRARCDCGDGSWAEIPTGTITLGTGHFRDLKGDARHAIDHYEHTGLAVADVAVGEDQHGVWVHGALRPDVPDERVIELRGASLSGDWRWIGGRLELVALLAVNVPGFPVPRMAWHESEGRETSLVAAGIVHPDHRAAVDLDAVYRRLAALEARQRLLDPMVEEALRDRLGL